MARWHAWSGIFICVLLNCVAAGGGEDEDAHPAILASSAAVFRAREGTPDFFTVSESSQELPDRIAGSYVPIGRVYDISLDRARLEEALGQSRALPQNGRVSFHSDLAAIEYTYDPDLLEDAGLLEEFGVFYFDSETQTWQMADRIEVDRSQHRVTAYTSHLTPFVLTAIVSPSTSTVPEAPACVAADYPGAPGGSADAQFMSVGPYFQYLRDRDYYVIPDQDFADLGFENSLGIATCNGNTACGPEANHKRYTGDAYITFTAHDDLDVYIMYDTRGGVNLADTSRDAPWIAAAGFVNTGKFIRTNDAVQRYRVYKRTYPKGTPVVLDGNRKGVTTPQIDTNYWVVLKRAGSPQSQAVSDICNATPVFNPPVSVGNLRGVPGRTTSTLIWQNPERPDFQGVVVRRSTTAAPANPGDGTAPGGSSSSPMTFSDSGLTNNTTYFYTVFAVYAGGTWPAASITLRTGPDSDGDGISNAYEDSATYSGGQTSRTQADTDSDGIPDGTELLQGTDPTNGDTSAPALNDFTRVSASPTSNPYVTFTLGSADADVTGWMVTLSAEKPHATDTRWLAAAPSGYLLAASGSYTLYAFVRDAAGNVSAPLSISAELSGIAAAQGAFVSEKLDGGLVHSIQKFLTDYGSGFLTPDFKEPVAAETIAMEIHKSGNFLYAISAAGPSASEIGVYRVEPAGLRLMQKVTLAPATGLAMDPRGMRLYVFNSFRVLVYDINQVNGELSAARVAANLAALPFGIVFDEAVNKAYVHGRCDGSWLIPRRDCLIHLLVNADGTLSQTTQTMLSGPGDATAPSSAARSVDGRYLYHAASGSGNTPQLTVLSPSPLTSIWSMGLSHRNSLRSLATHPGGNYLYGTAPGARRIASFRLTAGFPALDTEYDSIDPIDVLQMDPAGKSLYGLSRSTRVLSVFAVDAATGALVRTQSINLGAETPGTLVLRSIVTKNDPPIVSVSRYVPYGHYYPGWVEVNTQVSLLASGYDPDAERCGANSANYIQRWRLVNKPPASSLQIGTGSIANYALSNATFVPDVPGQYDLEYSFTDDMGSCEPAARTTTAALSITAGTRRGPVRVEVHATSDSIANHLPRFPPTAYPVHVNTKDMGNLVVVWCIGWLQCAPVCDRYQMEINMAHQQCTEQIAPWAGIYHWTHTHNMYEYDVYWLTNP